MQDANLTTATTALRAPAPTGDDGEPLLLCWDADFTPRLQEEEEAGATLVTPRIAWRPRRDRDESEQDDIGRPAGLWCRFEAAPHGATPGPGQHGLSGRDALWILIARTPASWRFIDDQTALAWGVCHQGTIESDWLLIPGAELPQQEGAKILIRQVEGGYTAERIPAEAAQ